MRHSSVVASLLLVACAGAEPTVELLAPDVAASPGPTGPADEPAALTDPRLAACALVRPARPWTTQETQALRQRTVQVFTQLKRENDQLVRTRGVGKYAGVKTATAKAIAAGDYATAAALIRPHLRPGYNALDVARTIEGTSCIGRVYMVLRTVYAELDRADEWRTLETCARGWDSDGMHFQQALIADGWASPSIGFVTDMQRFPGTDADTLIHSAFVRATSRTGLYYGVPVGPTRIENFLPSPGSSTVADRTRLLALGRTPFIAVGTLRAAFHVPLIVDAAAIPNELAPTTEPARGTWLAAKQAGEPFVMESHSLRQPWDATNLEVRPLTTVIAETFGSNYTYATGTIVKAPQP